MTARGTIRAGTVHTEHSMTLISKPTISRLLLEARNPTNVPKLNGLAYPVSFSSAGDAVLDNGDRYVSGSNEVL